MENLDLKCAEIGGKLAEIKVNGTWVDERAFAHALGVLEEQGPYACFLYLKAREGKAGKAIMDQSTSLLREVLGNSAAANNGLKFLESLAGDLDRLLFARDLLRQVFIYARYHAKARASAGEKA